MNSRFKLFTSLFFFLIFFQFSFGQLLNFALIVSKTNETCTGNGSLSFNVSGTTVGSTIVYSVFKLPNTTNPIAVLSTNIFTGLSAGNYRIIATQSLGTLSNTQQQDIQIDDLRNLVTYQLSSQATSCNTGNILVNVLTGIPSTYEIISGPIIVSPQTSPVFTNLPTGTYNIRVNDICGEGLVQTYTLSFVNPPNLNLGTFITNCSLNSCTTISGQLPINSNFSTSIRYPLTVQFTVFPPGGGLPIVINQSVNSGSATNLLVNVVVPFYHAQVYTYNIKVTDACGNNYDSIGNQINKSFSVNANETYTNCTKGIEIRVCNFSPPYSVNFIAAPIGFNPINYNTNHPGPFNSDIINYLSTNSNVLPNGNYIIEIADACGRFIQTQVVVQDVDPGYTFLINSDICSTTTIVKIPNNGPNVNSVIITSAPIGYNHQLPYNVSFNIVAGVFQMSLPPGSYAFQGFDVCGKPFSYSIVIPPKIINITVTAINATGCNISTGVINISATGALLSSIIVTQAPTSFNQAVPYDASGSIIPPLTTATLSNLPIGSYTLDISDSCGIHYTRTIIITAVISNAPLSYDVKKGCGENFGSIALVSSNGILQTVIITNAPALFSHTLPYNVSSNIAIDGIFYMNSLPEGSYTFYSKDACNVEKTVTIQILGYHLVNNAIQVIGHCSSFDLNMDYSDNAITSSHNFWLQQFNPLTNQWGHPITGVPYLANTIPDQTNSYFISNQSINYNISSFGTFRIVMEYYYYSNGASSLTACLDTIKTFDFSSELKLISANAILCPNGGGSEVIINAVGIAPLDYKITTKNGQPFIINNGTSNIFSGLQPGIYNFRVQDLCGNIVNRIFDITTLAQPSITASNLCSGMNSSLSVEPFAFLNYQWWKGTNTTTILSTTNVLSFNPFSNTTSPGTYYVRIYSSNTNSCVDTIISYTIPVSNNPNAGQDGTYIVCGSSPTAINLFTILVGNYDTGGTWEEVTSSGLLSGNTWLPVGIPVGTYIFKYKVAGFCNSSDESIVTIQLKQATELPVISVNSIYCSGEDIHFNIQSIANASYQWTGPNNFSSTVQNPSITNSTIDNSGDYTVTANANGCSNSATSSVHVNPIPNYSYESSCVGGVYKVLIIPIDDSFDPNIVTYQWAGPNGFESTNNPIIIANQPVGTYSVIVTNSELCSVSKSISVTNTFCDFPNVITPNNDGNNDFFDLTGYGVSNFQVYNRWGRLVYEQDNYSNQWYGQNRNEEMLPGATYYYFLQLKSGDEKHGWVLVAR